MERSVGVFSYYYIDMRKVSNDLFSKRIEHAFKYWGERKKFSFDDVKKYDILHSFGWHEKMVLRIEDWLLLCEEIWWHNTRSNVKPNELNNYLLKRIDKPLLAKMYKYYF